jgi:hypothetical protein
MLLKSLVLAITICAYANHAGHCQVSRKHRVGYTRITLPSIRQSDGQEVKLLLNVWYPTPDKGERIPLLDFTWLHLSPQDPDDSMRTSQITSLKSDLSRWFGGFEGRNWLELTKATTSSQIDASFMSQRFPLIIGRLRAFSTTHTIEELASHGFIICMLNGVDDFPPDNHEAYLRQVSDEIGFFVAVNEFFSKTLNLSTEKAGLLAFSGNGVSAFLAVMHTDVFSSLVLLESGVFLNDIYEIVRLHPYFSKIKFQTELLFLYNKQRFEKEQMKHLYDALPALSKELKLVDNEAQHHWDFATEGTIASIYLKNRPEEVRARQLAEFKWINLTIVDFFNRTLKPKDESEISFPAPED